MNLLHGGRSRDRLDAGSVLPLGAQGVLEVIADPQRPVHLVVTTVRSSRRSFVSWQPWDPQTRTGNCYRALPTATCDALFEAGLIQAGATVSDPGRQVQTISLTEAGRLSRGRLPAFAA